jgi:hypothetical protein
MTFRRNPSDTVVSTIAGLNCPWFFVSLAPFDFVGAVVLELLSRLQRGHALSSHGQPKTFTALAITSAMVVTATRLCTAIIPFAHRASGIVSVGEKAIALVRLTYR